MYHSHSQWSGSNQSNSPKKPSPSQIRETAEAIKYSLGDQVYAVIGGAACSLLGSTRETDDVDIVVPKGYTVTVRGLLAKQTTYFNVEKRTRYTYFKSDPRVEVEILTPPALFKESFDETTPVIVVNGVKILKPSLILNAKCNSILSRATDGKKSTDASDILFCLSWCASNHALPTAAEVPAATKQFVEWFIGQHGGQDHWTSAGYDWQTCMLSYALRLKCLISANISVNRVV